MNNRRRLVIALGASALAAPFPSFAQQPGKVWRIGVLETTSMALNAANFNMFRKGLLELGYAEGKNLVIDYRSAEGSVARFPELAAELVRLKVDLIVTRGTPALLAASNAAGTIPIVMAAIGEVPGQGIVASLAHPGGNVTGLSAFVTELTGKRLEILRKLIGKATRVAYLVDMSNPISLGQWKEAQAAAKSLRIQARLLDVRKPEDLGHAFDDAIKQRANGLVVGIDSLMQTNRQTIAELATKHRLPAIYASREFVDGGGLISYGVSYPDLYYRAAGHVDKIFKGKKPGDIPVEQPTKYELVINGNAAKALGIKIPNSILVRTDKVID